MKSDAELAAILFIAANGWGAEPTCGYYLADGNGDRCGGKIYGISVDDGCALCRKHLNMPDDDGVRISTRVIAAIDRLRREHLRAFKRSNRVKR